MLRLLTPWLRGRSPCLGEREGRAVGAVHGAAVLDDGVDLRGRGRHSVAVVNVLHHGDQPVDGVNNDLDLGDVGQLFLV